MTVGFSFSSSLALFIACLLKILNGSVTSATLISSIDSGIGVIGLFSPVLTSLNATSEKGLKSSDFSGIIVGFTTSVFEVSDIG